jgi:hypothetical protein
MPVQCMICDGSRVRWADKYPKPRQHGSLVIVCRMKDVPDEVPYTVPALERARARLSPTVASVGWPRTGCWAGGGGQISVPMKPRLRSAGQRRSSWRLVAVKDTSAEAGKVAQTPAGIPRSTQMGGFPQDRKNTSNRDQEMLSLVV